MTIKGLLQFRNIPFTVVVLPLPVIPQTKVCLLRSSSLREKTMLGKGLCPSETLPIIIPFGSDAIMGYTLPCFSSKSGTDSKGGVQIMPSSVEVMGANNGFVSVITGIRISFLVSSTYSYCRSGSTSVEDLANSPLKHDFKMFAAMIESAEYAMAVPHIPVLCPCFSRSIALSQKLINSSANPF